MKENIHTGGGDDRFQYTKDPDLFLAEDSFRALETVKEAMVDNPENRYVVPTILSSCYMAFGSERVDLKKLGPDVLLPRLNAFFIAYNDQVDLAEKIKDSDPEVYATIMDHVEKHKKKFEAYFEPTGDEEEDKRRQEFKHFFDVAFIEVDAVEHELFKVQDSEKTDPAEDNIELKRIKQGRELVNAIEILINIRACLGSGIFEDREIDQQVATDIDSLSKKYEWIIDPEYPDDELTEDERKARMLFFSAMSVQATGDIVDYKEDRLFDIWKEMTYMTEILKLSPDEAAKIMKKEATQYAMLAQKYGMSSLTTSVVGKGASVMLKVRSRALYNLPTSIRDKMVKRAEKGGHIREQVIAMLQDKHPEKYKI